MSIPVRFPNFEYVLSRLDPVARRELPYSVWHSLQNHWQELTADLSEEPVHPLGHVVFLAIEGPLLSSFTMLDHLRSHMADGLTASGTANNGESDVDCVADRIPGRFLGDSGSVLGPAPKVKVFGLDWPVGWHSIVTVELDLRIGEAGFERMSILI